MLAVEAHIIMQLKLLAHLKTYQECFFNGFWQLHTESVKKRSRAAVMKSFSAVLTYYQCFVRSILLLLSFVII